VKKQKQRTRKAFKDSLLRRRLREIPLHYRRNSSGCWIWTGSLIDGHYPVSRLYVKSKGYTWPARRVMWLREIGAIPAGKQIVSDCGHELCVNPLHLEALTHAEVHQRSSKAKIDGDDVREIRELVRFGLPMKDIGAAYDITGEEVSQIVSGKRWANAA
jgi:hypothetical protein